MKKIKIALNNWIASSGKDTVADYLCSEFGFKKYALADGIREIAHKYYNIPETKRPPRELMHLIGESLRKYDIMLWINYTLKKIEEEGNDRVIITDVRKLLEHSVLKERGWNNVMVYCDENIVLNRIRQRDGENVNIDLIKNSTLENQLRPLKDAMPIFDNSGDFNNTANQIDEYITSLIDK